MHVISVALKAATTRSASFRNTFITISAIITVTATVLAPDEDGDDTGVAAVAGAGDGTAVCTLVDDPVDDVVDDDVDGDRTVAAFIVEMGGSESVWSATSAVSAS